MSHIPHELHEEFPEQADLLRELEQTNTHVARLAKEYHDINKLLHRVETNLQPMSDIEAVRLRKQRLALKDDIARSLRDAEVS
ncbi:MAG: DUF465 domain-containing protein [Pseudomonadota bacterium]